MNTRRYRLLALVLASVLIASPAVSFAAITGRIVENKGIKTARLGLHDSTDRKRIGGSYKKTVDKSYAGQTVYKYVFGAKSGGHYGLEMYSKANHHVFTFIIYSTKLKTSNGTHVGNSEAVLVQRYGSRITKQTTPTWVYYYMGTSSGRTEFWVRSGKVHHIIISRY